MDETKNEWMTQEDVCVCVCVCVCVLLLPENKENGLQSSGRRSAALRGRVPGQQEGC